MRRGLMYWDQNEIPLADLTGRVSALQQHMAAANIDAMLLYTNFIRSAAVSHLTGFSPYWADGVLMVPRTGTPIFATTLSNRVASWVATVKPVGDLLHSPQPCAALGERFAADPSIRRIAILELDDFPAGLYDELAGKLSNVEILDATAIFAAARHRPDALEARLLAHADQIAAAALHQAIGATTVGTAVGAVEGHAREAGAEEAYLAIAPDLASDHRFLRLSGGDAVADIFAIRATVAYKGSWVRRARTYATRPEDAARIAAAEAWFAALRIDPAAPIAPQLAVPGGELKDWLIEASTGSRPLSVLASRAAPAKNPLPPQGLVLTLRADLQGTPWCAAALITTIA